MRLVFCGTPQFAVPTLQALLHAGHTVELVLSQPDRRSGRGLEVQVSPVKQFAARSSLPLAQPEKIRHNDELKDQLSSIAPDAIIVVAYGRLIPQWMLALPRYGNLNLHASLLPKYRGAAPIQWAVANGESETGVTIMRIDEGLDTGAILLQERVPILSGQTSVELAPTLSTTGAELMVKTLTGLEADTLHPVPQDNTQATLAPILAREDGCIDWGSKAAQIYNRWRGFQPWPGVFSYFRGRKIIFHEIRVAGLQEQAAAGTLLRHEGQVFAACADGTWLELIEVQMEGRRRMAAGAFINGASIASGERLG